MCDRTQTEILARELAIEYFLGMNKALLKEERLDVKENVEKHWSQWNSQAERILNSLHGHYFEEGEHFPCATAMKNEG